MRGDRPRRRLAPALPAAFYDRPTEQVARDLLGATLVCETADGIAGGRIVETEAYLGPHYDACHGVFGLTPRTEKLFGSPGTAYVYFIYGVHWCFNTVTMPKGHPSAVLVRALEPTIGVDLMRTRRPAAKRDIDLTNGPGKLCQALGIDRSHDGMSLQRGPITIRRGDAVPDASVLVSPRIGITRAADWPLRWFVRDNPFVSRAPRHFTSHPLAT